MICVSVCVMIMTMLFLFPRRCQHHRLSLNTFQRRISSHSASTKLIPPTVSEINNNNNNNNSKVKVVQHSCTHFANCSGCSLASQLQSIPIVRRANVFFQLHNAPFTMVPDMSSNRTPPSNTTNNNNSNNNNKVANSNEEWRTLAKLAVQPQSRWGGLKIGLFGTNSHLVIPVPACEAHHPLINKAVSKLVEYGLTAGVTGYTHGIDKTYQGNLRYVQLAVERHTQKIQLVVVWNAATLKQADDSLHRLVKRIKEEPDFWHSVTVNFQTSSNNAIFNYNSKAWHLLWGPVAVKEQIGKVIFQLPPQVFRQANLDFFESGIVPLVVDNVPEGSAVTELYSGVGVLGLNVVAAKSISELRCSDNNEFIRPAFDKTIRSSLTPSQQQVVSFQCLTAVEAVEQGECRDSDVIIVDPPRKGLDKEVLDYFIQQSHQPLTASRLIYVSCGFDSLVRDTELLLRSNEWKIRHAHGFLLFPGSDHIETVVVFDHKET